MNKSTRAPWLVGETLNGLPAIIGDGDSVVAYMPNEANGCTYKPDDARLIAAAPRLLALVRSALALAACCVSVDGYSRKEIEEMGRAMSDEYRAAIAAATGETK